MESLFGDFQFDSDCGTENIVRCCLRKQIFQGEAVKENEKKLESLRMAVHCPYPCLLIPCLKKLPLSAINCKFPLSSQVLTGNGNLSGGETSLLFP